jgi:hypothetical protein
VPPSVFRMGGGSRRGMSTASVMPRPGRWPSPEPPVVLLPREQRSTSERTVSPCAPRRARPPPSHVVRVRQRISYLPLPRERGVSPGRRCRPSIDIIRGASSHELAPASARRCHASDSFRPRGLSPPRRLAPPRTSWACCIPLPTMGFIGFPSAARRVPATPRDVFTDAIPSRAFPSSAAVLTRT